jgi:hypothetical protein
METQRMRTYILEVYQVLNGFEGLREDFFSRYIVRKLGAFNEIIQRD